MYHLPHISPFSGFLWYKWCFLFCLSLLEGTDLALALFWTEFWYTANAYLLFVCWFQAIKIFLVLRTVSSHICLKKNWTISYDFSLKGEGHTGQLLSNHPDVNKMTFTGSVPSGSKVMEACAKVNLNSENAKTWPIHNWKWKKK